MKHRANPKFWSFYKALPKDVRDLSDKNFQLLKRDPYHPSLHFKRVGRFWTARVGLEYRVVATQREQDIVWFWIGPHVEYKRLLRKK